MDATLFATLKQLSKMRSATPPELYEVIFDNDCITVTAINQRLSDLLVLGCVRREREGRAWRYFVVR